MHLCTALRLHMLSERNITLQLHTQVLKYKLKAFALGGQSHENDHSGKLH